MLRRSTHETRRPLPALVNAATGWLLIAAALAMGVASPQAAARRSDPVRNLYPEESACQETVQNPAYAAMPLGSVADTEHPPAESLLQQFLSKHTSMDYPAAAEAALRLIEATPDRPAGYYNLACALARMQRQDEAFAALQQAIDRGWRERVHMSIDPDLASLRGDPRFATLLRTLQDQMEAERITPTSWRSDPWQAIVADLTRETPELLARYHVPGAVVALVHDGKVVWTSAFGIRDNRKPQALRTEDRFRLRAPLHLFAIAACQQLQQERKVELARLIVEAAREQVETVTIAGGAMGDDREQDRDRRAQPAAARDRPVIGLATEGRPTSVRSNVRNYSRRSAYGFLRLAIEAAAGTEFPRYCEAAIFGPLGLKGSPFAAPDGDDVLVPGHSYLGTPLRPGVFHSEFAPGGCVYMSAGDLATLVSNALPWSVETDPESGIFLQEATTSQGGLAGAIDLVTQADSAMSGGLGLALRRQDTEHGVRMQLDESAGGLVCLARWHPQTRRGVVVVCNSATARDAAERLAHVALGGE